MFSDIAAATPAWAVFGIIAWLIFFSRFYVQWIWSEWKGRSEVPLVFWYQSAVGSVMLLVWAWYQQSPPGALSQSMNLIPYSRNLIHIWRERGVLSRKLNIITHMMVAASVLLGIGVVGITWGKAVNQETATGWFWLSFSLLGQGLFASRFLIQWIVTEQQKRSVVPTVFWHISILAAMLLFASHAARSEWLFATGQLATVVVYVRNVWMIYTEKARFQPS